MSTFRGVMDEFLDIRVDFFCRNSEGRPALACFLSHVHSDHLSGLDSFRSPFVYCSTATKELLLNLERRFCRINFANGLLEGRVQSYKHLKKLLRPIPLETPTQIELAPGNVIQVTLFDANHCTGAVMFLFEGSGKAVLYTGDIRSEPWFVNSLARNPFLIEYTSGLKTLDCIYLDTSNTGPLTFPTKADGLQELLQKVSRYPPDTVFHFTAWTFGYEEVWMALSRALKCRIHVDQYKMRLYKSLGGDHKEKDRKFSAFVAHAGPVLAGYTCGNSPQSGVLTTDTSVRLHSCEKGMHCPAINEKTVWIKPIITRTRNGAEVGEIGIGGGGGDLTHRAELELDDYDAVEQCVELIQQTYAKDDDRAIMEARRMLVEVLKSPGQALSLYEIGLEQDEEISLERLMQFIKQLTSKKQRASLPSRNEDMGDRGNLPKVITFPYSRHSSYVELCDLVRTFKPKDVYPCTVDEANWHEGISIEHLFGHHCSHGSFRHDAEMWKILVDKESVLSQQTHSSQSNTSSPIIRDHKPHQKHALNAPTDRLVRRDAQGRLRVFNSQGYEIALITESQPQPAVPQNISAFSPDSESQSLRRKAVHDMLQAGPTKRARLHFDGPAASKSPEPFKLSDDEVSHVTPESDEQRPPPLPDELNNPWSQVGSEVGEGGYWEHDDETFETYFDIRDQVTRCQKCGHEVWSAHIGFCTGCNAGRSGSLYYEIIPPGKLRLQIEAHENAHEFVDPENGDQLLGDYLDTRSSAYDSQDLNPDFKIEEYEQNSFIDNSSVKDDDSSLMDDDTSSSNGETEDSFMLNAVAPDLNVTDSILSQAMGQSQTSELLTMERLRDRALAFEAVSSEDGRGWQDVSLVSVGDNHTHAEIEL